MLQEDTIDLAKRLLKDRSLSANSILDRLICLHNEIHCSTSTFGSIFKNIFKKVPYIEFSCRAKELAKAAWTLYQGDAEYNKLLDETNNLYFKSGGRGKGGFPINPKHRDICIYNYALENYICSLYNETAALFDRQKLFYNPDYEQKPTKTNPSLDELSSAESMYKTCTNSRIKAGAELCELYEKLFPNEDR